MNVNQIMPGVLNKQDVHCHENGEISGKKGSVIDGRAVKEKLDPVAESKKRAQKQAMKMIGDAFAGDAKIDADLDSRRQKVQQLGREIGENNRAIHEIEASRAQLRENYGIEADSQEEKDLKLLEKEVESKLSGSQIRLTREETEEIARIQANGLTEYQQRSLEMKRHESPYAEAVYAAWEELQTENAVIRATSLERLKSDPMVKAQKQADAVLDAAGKEAMGMLFEEGVDHIKEEQTEEKEKAQQRAEKAAELEERIDLVKEKETELEERIDSAKEKEKQQEKLTQDILEAAANMTENGREVSLAKQEIKEMLGKMKLIEEDVKGAAVDSAV